MLKKLLSFGLACLLTFIAANVQPVLAQQTANQQSDMEGALKACVLHQVAGHVEPRIEVTLHNGQKLKGSIGETTEDYFVIFYHGNRTVIPYNEVASFKCGRTHNLGADIGKLAIGVGIALGVALILGVLVARETR